MSKHPILPGTDLSTIRNLFLKHEDRRANMLLATAIDHLKCPAQEADAFLRTLAMAGYLEWGGRAGENLDWELTEHGRRLLADRLGARISRQRAHAIIDEITGRARKINEDPDRLARVKELKLFGSVLDPDREDFGDVDIEVEIEIRQFPEGEVARARAKIAAEVPISWRNHFIRRLKAEEGYDRRRVFSALNKGINGLSLSQDIITTLGCEYRRVYRFDVQTGEELAPDDTITPRTTAPPVAADEIRVSTLPERTVIPPIGLLRADDKVRSDALKISMASIARVEAQAWLGQLLPDGSRIATDTRKNPDQRFVGARFLFDEWRDPCLTGLELFQRALDWASLYKLPISKLERKFVLRTYGNTRIANFHALMVQRVADRIDAHLVLEKPKDAGRFWYRPGGSTFTTPRMIATHHALAIALARMLDETGLTGQTTFKAEFDLTAERRNAYPALPDLSRHSRRLRKALSKVEFPQAVLNEARGHMEDYDVNLPLNRQVEIMATWLGKKDKKVVGFASATLGEQWKDEDIEDPELPGEFLAGEEYLWQLAEPITNLLKDSLSEIPGCQRLSMSHSIPVPS